MSYNPYPRVFGKLDKNPISTNYVVVSRDIDGIYFPVAFNVFKDAYHLYTEALKTDTEANLSMEEIYPHISMYFDFDSERKAWKLYSIVPKEDIYVR